jgi:hypothetical protein
MWAYIAEDEGPDDEGITAYYNGTEWMPMVGADKERMESLKPAARELAKAARRPIKLVRFFIREEIEVIK